MTEEVELLDAEPRRRSGLGFSPLGLAPVEPKRGVLGALREHDEWVATHGRELRVVFRAPVVAPPVEVVAAEVPAPVVEWVEPPEVDIPAEQVPAVVGVEELEQPVSVSELLGRAPAAAPSTSDLLARLKAMKVDG